MRRWMCSCSLTATQSGRFNDLVVWFVSGTRKRGYGAPLLNDGLAILGDGGYPATVRRAARRGCW